MELKEYIRIIQKKWYLVFGITLLSVVLGSLYSFVFMTPTFESSIPVIIGSVQQQTNSSTNPNTQSYNDIMMYQKLVKTYCEFVKTRLVIEDALNTSGIKTDYETAKNMITVTSQNDTEFLKISVKSKNRYEAALFANSLAKSLKDISYSVKNVDNVQLVDGATIPNNPINKSPFVYIFISLLLGLTASIALILFIDFMDNTVKSTDGLENLLGTAAIGSIPVTSNKSKKLNNEEVNISDAIVTYFKPLSFASESYKSLRTNVQFSTLDNASSVISVTSCAPAEGKSTVISNLAVTIAQSGKKVILVDSDLRKPVVHKNFKLPNQIGLTNVLLGQSDLSKVIHQTQIENLSVLTSGTIPPNPSEILTSKKYIELINSLKSEFDYVLIDAPPVLVVTDAQIIASNVDGMLLVTKYGFTEKSALIKAKESLDKVKAKTLGVIINQIPIKELGYYGYGKKYGYKYGNNDGNGYYIFE